MKVSFLFPGSGPYEALDNWVRTLGRHCQRNKVRLVRLPEECRESDFTFVLTEARTYPEAQISAHLEALRSQGTRFGVCHNNDIGGPPPGPYPSFCWTEGSKKALAKYAPWLYRQPLFRPIVEEKKPPLLLATFGHIEPKKMTLEMFWWAKRNRIPFRVYGPRVYATEYKDYIGHMDYQGCSIVQYDWHDQIEDLAPLFDEVSHFLFVLPESKRGAGGSPTSPRYAGFFHRPVIVVDDEDTFEQDGFHVFPSLNAILKTPFEKMPVPNYLEGPDDYIEKLCIQTERFYYGTLP